MLTRCPSCAAEIDDSAPRCPICHWDFAAFKRIPPAESSGQPPAPPEKEEPPPPPQPEKPIEEGKKFSPPSLQKRRPSSLSQSKSAPIKATPADAPAFLGPTTPLKKISPKPSEPKPPPEPAKPLKIKPSFEVGEEEKKPAPRGLGPAAKTYGIVAGAAILAAAGLMAVHLHRRPAKRPAATRTAPAPAPAPKAPTAPPQIKIPEASTAPPARPAPAPTPVAPPTPRAPATPAAPAAPKHPAPQVPPSVWVFEGEVYDLINLTAVYAAKLTFKDSAGNVKGRTTTGDEGRFRITLESLVGGYQLEVEQPDYFPRYLDDIDPSYRELPEEQRQFLADSVATHGPWIGNTATPTRRDLVLIPKSSTQP